MTAKWMLVAVAALCAVTSLAAAQDWWETATIYQIYPRSFQDSDGDGTGDLKGITSRLGHLQELGINVIWMSPIFVSPMADFGYDISDFYDIDPIFGTMEDFDELIAAANVLGIKIVLDFVPNHSSDESEWFVKSVARDPVYEDYYIWRDPIGFDGGNPIPPNQWIGSFSEPVWTWVPERNQFYYHIYNVKQPDLNYRNGLVRQEMESILTFWMDKGAHGFRVDTVHTLIEDESYPNVPSDEAWPYWANQPLTYVNVQEWRKVLDDYSRRDNFTRVLMTEAYGDTFQLMEYYGNSVNRGAHFTFNFMFILNVNSGSSAGDFKETIDTWMFNMPIGGTANWVVGNHDQDRVASRYGTELSIGIAMLTLMLPGVGVIYNGEEIGMLDNTDITYEQGQDPQGCNAGPDGFADRSRDFQRTPFQWDDTKNAGFSSADVTWLPVHSNYVTLNLEAQRAPALSHFNIYKTLIATKKTDTIMRGSLSAQDFNQDVIAIQRELEGALTYVVVVNLRGDVQTVNLNDRFHRLAPSLTVVTTSMNSGFTVGGTVASNSVRLPAFSSVLLSGDITFLPCS